MAYKLLALCFLFSFTSVVVSKSLNTILQEDIEHALSKQQRNLVQVAEDLGLSILIKAATKAGLAETLESKGPFTLFGPTDKAFNSLPPNVVELLKNTTILRGVLLYHALSGTVLSKDLENDLIVPTLLPQYKLRINVFRKKTGTVYTAACHNITKPDQLASNGVLHVVDGVMLPFNGTLTDLVVMEKEYFSFLLMLVVKAGLADTLSGPGPFTLFAPVNEAFAKLDPALVKKLLSDLDLLKKVLLYHVVPETMCAAGLEDGMELPTVEGSKLKVSLTSGVKVGPATVVYANANVVNGISHVIDTVLIPPSLLA